MSIRVMTTIWDSGRYEGGELLVLLALADWADDGGRCYPSVPSIARKARLTERQVYNILRKMREENVVICEPGGGRGRPSVYVINTAIISGFSSKKNPEICDTKTLKSVTRNPEICDKPPHPLIGRTVKEPSKEPPAKAGEGAIRKAAQHVCREWTFTSPKIEKAVTDAIRLALKHPDCDRDATQLGEFMARRWGEYLEAADLLRYQVSPEKFFTDGLWRQDAAWPIDQQRLQRQREARVGVSRR